MQILLEVFVTPHSVTLLVLTLEDANLDLEETFAIALGYLDGAELTAILQSVSINAFTEESALVQTSAIALELDMLDLFVEVMKTNA